MAELAFCQLTAAIRERKNFYPKPAAFEDLIPHIKTCLEWVDMVDRQSSKIDWQLLAEVCRYQGFNDGAEKLYQLALEKIGKDKPGPGRSFGTAKLRMRLGLVYVQLRRLSDAENQYNLALKELSNTGQDTDVSDSDKEDYRQLEVKISARMASLYKLQNRLEEAESQYYAIFSDYERIWGPEHLRTLRLIEHFASTLQARTKYEEAEALYRRVLVAYLKQFGRDHPISSKVQQKLANTLQLRGQYDKARTLFKQALSASEKRLGSEHPETLRITASLATLSGLQGDYTTAEEQYLRVLEAQERILGKYHPDTLNVVENLALNYQVQEKFAEAEMYYLKALKGRNGPGSGMEHIRETVLRLVGVYEAQNESGKAEKLLEEYKDEILCLRKDDS